MESNRPRKYKFRNKKKKIYMDWSHTKKEYREIPKAALCEILKEAGREEVLRIAEKIEEAGRSLNELMFLAAYRQKWKELLDNLCS
jgi:histone H3/H4